MTMMGPMEALGRLTAAAVRLRSLSIRANLTAGTLEERWTRGLAGAPPVSMAPRHGVSLNQGEANCDRVAMPEDWSDDDGGRMMRESACVGCQFTIEVGRMIRRLAADIEGARKTVESLRAVISAVPKAGAPEEITGQTSNGGVQA